MYYIENEKNYLKQYRFCEFSVFSGLEWKEKADQMFGDDVEKIEKYLNDLEEVEFTDSDIDGVAVGRWQIVV